ncbi:MAG: hypothetical protein GX444_08960 [Myxococcales bacterium]|nr:hypothetical protein [Myxococcales bacterium]
MIAKVWKTIRLAPALIGLGLPMAPLGLTRYRWWAGAIVILLGIIALWSRERYRRLYRGIVAFYLLAAVAMIVRTAEIIASITPHPWWRILLTAGALAVFFVGADQIEKKYAKLPAYQESHPWALIGRDLLLYLGAVAILRLGQYNLWANPAFFSGLLVAFPIIHFRPRPVVAALFAAICAIIIFEWHGFMNTQYIPRIPKNPPAGIQVEMLPFGNPQAGQGARFFSAGKCPETYGSYYMGEMVRTYRLNPDGSTVDLVLPDENHPNESVCAVVELCDERVVITGSDEDRFVRFSDLLTGETLKDIPMRGQPTFLVLSPDQKSIYVSIINPGGLVRINLATRSIDRELMRFNQIDPAFSGTNNLIIVGNRIVSAYSSYYTIDNRQGEVFSVNLDLEDYRPLFPFYGSWGIVAPEDENHVFFKVYSRPDLYRVALDGSGAQRIADVPAGYHYLVYLPKVSAVVINHWITGDVMALCIPNTEKRFHLDFGAMGRPMTVFGNRVMTATPAGYATITYPENLCR